MKKLLMEDELKSCIGGASAVEQAILAQIQSLVISTFGPIGQVLINIQNKTLAATTGALNDKLFDFYSKLNASLLAAVTPPPA